MSVTHLSNIRHGSPNEFLMLPKQGMIESKLINSTKKFPLLATDQLA